MDEGSDQQIAAEAGRRAGAMQLAPRQPQFWCRPIEQLGNLMVGLGGVSRTHLWRMKMWSCTRDEGGPLDAGGQAQASNHCKLLSSKAMVVSVAAKGGTRSRQV
jgi:hypothetical protein